MRLSPRLTRPSARARYSTWSTACIRRCAEEAFASEASRAHRVTDRVIGLQANASAKSPEELEGRRHLDADPPEMLADAIFRLRRRFGTKILGGCCGTDDRHIAWIARRAKESARPIL